MRLITKRKARILDFDVECRPLSWYGGDFVTKEITAIACQFVGDKEAHCWLLGRDEPLDMLRGFCELYDSADIVTGHFIRGFDLPIINSALLEYGLPTLGDKLTHDTKLDLVKFSGLSTSQENLGAMLGLKHPKVQMDQAKWRAANRLQVDGLAFTQKRVIGDVRQHIEMRQRMLELGMLGPLKRWSGKSSGIGNYHA